LSFHGDLTTSIGKYTLTLMWDLLKFQGFFLNPPQKAQDNKKPFSSLVKQPPRQVKSPRPAPHTPPYSRPSHLSYPTKNRLGPSVVGLTRPTLSPCHDDHLSNPSPNPSRTHTASKLVRCGLGTFATILGLRHFPLLPLVSGQSQHPIHGILGVFPHTLPPPPGLPVLRALLTDCASSFWSLFP